MIKMRIKKIIGFLLVFVIAFSQVAVCSITGSAKKDGKKIMVSMGDSYSSGEGVEDFYHQNWSEKAKSTDPDFLAHRSEESWPGQLKLKGVGTMKDHKNDGKNNQNWYFVAASGAETKHFKKKQVKDFDRGGIAFCPELDPQLDVFKNFKKNEVDYVTMTIGGNDVGFSDIIFNAATSTKNHRFLNPCSLAKQLKKAWDKFYGRGQYADKKSVKDKLRDTYKAVRDAAGEQTNIIVAGYPKLIEVNHSFQIYFSEYEAKEINKSVSQFNVEIESIVKNLHDKDKYNIYFATVEGKDGFDGHGAYSKDTPYINEIKFKKAQNLADDLVSAYSMHPNKDGLMVYADCVQRVINKIEGNEKDNDSSEKHAGNWQQSYMDFLQNYAKGLDNPDNYGFSLIYLDDDDIPELVIREGDSHGLANVSIYNYANSKVVELADHLSAPYGVLRYIEREGIVYISYTNGGKSSIRIYSLDAGNFKLKMSLYTDEGGVPPEVTPTYSINDEKVSKSEFYGVLNEYPEEDFSVTSNDMAFTTENIESILNFK